MNIFKMIRSVKAEQTLTRFKEWLEKNTSSMSLEQSDIRLNADGPSTYTLTLEIKTSGGSTETIEQIEHLRKEQTLLNVAYGGVVMENMTVKKIDFRAEPSEISYINTWRNSVISPNTVKWTIVLEASMHREQWQKAKTTIDLTNYNGWNSLRERRLAAL